MAEAYKISKDEALSLMQKPKTGILPRWLPVKNANNDFDTACILMDTNGVGTKFQFKGEVKRGKRAKFVRYVFTMYDLSFKKHRIYQIDSGEELKRKGKAASQHDCPHEHIGAERVELPDFIGATMDDYMEHALKRCNISIKFDDDYESLTSSEFSLKNY